MVIACNHYASQATHVYLKCIVYVNGRATSNDMGLWPNQLKKTKIRLLSLSLSLSLSLCKASLALVPRVTTFVPVVQKR